MTIPKEFAEALGDKRPLYIKGMTMRHANYGIGALTYFRCVIQDTTDERGGNGHPEVPAALPAAFPFVDLIAVHRSTETLFKGSNGVEGQV